MLVMFWCFYIVKNTNTTSSVFSLSWSWPDEDEWKKMSLSSYSSELGHTSYKASEPIFEGVYIQRSYHFNMDCSLSQVGKNDIIPLHCTFSTLHFKRPKIINFNPSKGSFGVTLSETSLPSAGILTEYLVFKRWHNLRFALDAKTLQAWMTCSTNCLLSNAYNG